MVPVAAIFLLMMADAPSGVASIGKPGVVRPSADTRFEIRLLDLSVVRRLVNTLAREAPAMTEGERAAAWADFSLVSQAVLGVVEVGPFDFDDLARATTSGEGPRVPATQGVNLRDTAAYQLLALGYSARETADVISGRISRQSLDTASQMLAVGLARKAAANYLDGEYRRATASRAVRNAPAPRVRMPPSRRCSMRSSTSMRAFMEWRRRS
jgi:hypothetical protein